MIVNNLKSESETPAGRVHAKLENRWAALVPTSWWLGDGDIDWLHVGSRDDRLFQLSAGVQPKCMEEQKYGVYGGAVLELRLHPSGLKYPIHDSPTGRFLGRAWLMENRGNAVGLAVRAV